MKFLALVLFAVASVVSSQEVALDHQAILDVASADVIAAFSEGLDEVPVPDPSLKDEAEKVKSELVKTLQDALQRAVEQLKFRIDHHHKKLNDVVEKIHELKDRLKQHHADLGDRVRSAIGSLKSKAKEHLKDLLAAFGRKTVEDILGASDDASREKRAIRDFVDIEIKEEVAAEKLCNVFLKIVPEVKKEEVKVYCKQHLQSFVKLINKWLAPRNSRNKRSVNEVSEAIKDFFRDIKITYREKYADFAEWLRNSYKNALEKASTRHEKLRSVAIEAKKKMGEMKKQAAQELLDAMRPYRQELGKLYDDLVEASKQVFKKKEKTE